MTGIAPDGSPVLLYARLPPLGEPELIHAAVGGFPRDWTPSTDWSVHGGVRLRLRSFTLEGEVVSGEMEYVVDHRQLVHAFESKLLGDEELEEDLRGRTPAARARSTSAARG